MAAVTAEQVREARAAGYTAGYTHAPPSPNPYAPEHVPVWRQSRTADERVAAEHQSAATKILARVWRVGYEKGQSAYTRERGLSAPSV